MIRLYAPIVGDGSLVVVGCGLASAFETLGVYEANVPTDVMLGEGEMIAGADAPIGIVVGNPRWLHLATAMGNHELLVLEYAPNSRHQPISFHNAARSAGVRLIITPSEWAKRVLIESWGDSIPIEVVRHGINSRFHSIVSTAPKNTFIILHHAGSSPERKGTLELIRAVEAWDRDDVLLRISCSMESAMEIGRSPEASTAKHVELVLPIGRARNVSASWPESAIEQYRSSHIVCQPSRSEGFGLVPLEARACGVPVVMTTCTGHEEHAFADPATLCPGIIGIPVREDLPMVCEMGGTAPRVDPDLIIEALDRAYIAFDTLKAQTLDAANGVREYWSWQAQVAPWTKRVCEEMIL